mgnify:CR=1 FL=1
MKKIRTFMIALLAVISIGVCVYAFNMPLSTEVEIKLSNDYTFAGFGGILISTALFFMLRED